MSEPTDYARLGLGDWAPWFHARTPSTSSYNFGSISGFWMLMVFAGSTSDPVAAQALAKLEAARPLFGQKTMLFCVTADPQDVPRVKDTLPGWRWFLDGEDLAISRLYGAAPQATEALYDAATYRPCAILLDPQQRVFKRVDLGQLDEVLDLVRRVPSPENHAGIEMHAPVLIIPRVFEPALCERLVEEYTNGAIQASGVMRQRGDRTVMEMDRGFKRRTDHFIADQDLIAAMCARIERRVVEPIKRAFQFTATNVERHVVACYDSADGGRFLPHRDNTTIGTAHRRFGVSINLNDDFEGGDLMFPEFGPRRYKAPTGGAVVFGCGLLHYVAPVTEGRRFAYLPFLYDEEAAEIRQRNLHSLGDEAETETETESLKD